MEQSLLDQKTAIPHEYFEVLDPRGSIELKSDPYTLSLATDTPVVALISNGFPGTPLMMEGLLAELASLRPRWEFRSYTKLRLSGESSEEFLQDIVNACDAAVGLYGHCGSCTAGTMRDAISIARLGIPSVALIASHFLSCGSMVAQGAGMPEIPVVELPYPIASLPAGAMRDVAAAAAPRIVQAFEART